jgi:hypothetical protein
VPVGKLIALLAEEGDDLSNIEIPAEATSAAPSVPKPGPAQPSTPSPSAPEGPTVHIHPDGPIFPSVLRLLNELHVSDFKNIKGTGLRGMLSSMCPPRSLTSQDLRVLQLRRRTSRYSQLLLPLDEVDHEFQPLDGLALRQLIVLGLSETTAKKSALPKGLYPILSGP